MADAKWSNDTDFAPQPTILATDRIMGLRSGANIKSLGVLASTAQVTGLDTALAAKMDQVLTTKGDLVGFSTLPVRVPVGTNGQVPVADSKEAAGWKWGSNAASSVVISQIFYSAVYGNDSTGEGTQSNPFASYDHSVAYIIANFTPTAQSMFEVVSDCSNTGVTGIVLEPFILWRGVSPDATTVSDGSPDQAVTLSANWDGVANAYSKITNIGFITGTGINFDTTALTAFSGRVDLENVRTTNDVLLTAKSGHTFVVGSCFNRFDTPVIATDIFNYESFGNYYNSFQINAIARTAFANMSCENYTGNIVCIASSGHNGQIYLSSSVKPQQMESTGADANIFVDSISYVTPVASTGAVTLGTFANSIDGGFTPDNYVPVDDSVQGHLEGIDAKLGSEVTVSGTTVTIMPNTRYYVSSGLPVSMTMSSTWNKGDWFEVIGLAAAEYKIIQLSSPSQKIYMGDKSTTSGAAGYTIPQPGQEIGSWIRVINADSVSTFFACALAGNFDLL